MSQLKNNSAIMLTLFILSSFSFGSSKFIHQNGYDNCIELSNGNTRVVLEPICGGRVLIYELKDSRKKDDDVFIFLDIK